MMEVRRLDLGADVVCLPERKLLVIHPDLDYAEALGAVSATLPHLHIDNVQRLVEKVTPRPKKPRPTRRLAGALVAAVALIAGMLLAPGGNPAAASAAFGEIWQEQMANLGMACEPDLPGRAWTCFDAEQDIVKVSGYRREDRTLYVVRDAADDATTCVIVFRDRDAARRWQVQHPDVEVTGKVAIWT